MLELESHAQAFVLCGCMKNKQIVVWLKPRILLVIAA